MSRARASRDLKQLCILFRQIGLFVGIFVCLSAFLVCFPVIWFVFHLFKNLENIFCIQISLNYIHRNAFEPALETRTKTVIKIITITLLMTQNTQKIINPLDFCWSWFWCPLWLSFADWGGWYHGIGISAGLRCAGEMITPAMLPEKQLKT